MARLPAPDSRFIPYAEASPAQLVQALVMAKEALDPYFPALTWPQWHRAFDDIRPPLRIAGNQSDISSEGLTKLTLYFEALHSSSEPDYRLPPEPITVPEPGAASDTWLTTSSQETVKRTYMLHPDIHESLERASFWLRERKSALVNRALMQLLAGYPESQVPLPVQEG